MTFETNDLLHELEQLKGRVGTHSKVQITTPQELARYYTPGVGQVARHFAQHPQDARRYSTKANSVAVISDGSAVLGLGNVGPYGALPVMEGKAALFSAFAGIDAYPIVLDTQKPSEVIAAIRAIAPGFGGINLEDIGAPQCYEIEDALQNLGIPVVHDDQHATAIVALAGLINAFVVADKMLVKAKVVVLGAGAAGSAVAKLLYHYGIKNVMVVDSKGIVAKSRTDLDKVKLELANLTNPMNISGSLEDAIIRADAVIGVAAAGLIKPAHIQAMNDRPIVFALSNPEPEIEPEAAIKAGAFIMATGRSDFPNQINNVLVFPGLFRGALDNNVQRLTTNMKLAAAKALAGLVPNPSPERIIPSVFDAGVVQAVANSIRE